MLRTPLVVSLVLLAGCSAGVSYDVDAEYVPAEGSLLLFRLDIRATNGDFTDFDPEQHVLLETQGGNLTPASVYVDPESTSKHAEYTLGFHASRDQDVTLFVNAIGDEQRRFPFTSEELNVEPPEPPAQ